MPQISIGLDGYKIIQLTNQSPIQMMSYLICTPGGRLIVIDGGTKADAAHLRKRIREYGDKVDYWLLTHAHSDHMGALTRLIEEDKLPEIGCLAYDFPEFDYFNKIEPSCKESRVDFSREISKYRGPVWKPRRGEFREIDGLKFTVLNELLNTPEDYPSVNDSSLVFRFEFPRRTALFVGDLGVAAGKWLLRDVPADVIKNDILQMAHHGQSGVNKDFYSAVAPELCLWPTPDWLWVNNNGGGINSGPWTTFETRRWVEELGIKQHAVMMDGEYSII